MRQSEEESSQRENVNSMLQYLRVISAAHEIRVIPKLKEQRIVKPVAMTLRVQIEKSRASADGRSIGKVAIPK
jgi:hypothetical protein